jgi:hypothetical protein
MVKVLPEPVTDGDAALRLFRPGGAVRRPQLAVLEQRIAGFDERRERFHRRGDRRAGAERDGVLQRGVHAGDRVEAGGGAGLRIGRAADGNAAGGFGDGHLLRVAARGVLHRLAVLARLGGDLAAAFDARCLRLGLELLHPVGDAAGERLALFRRDSLILLVPLEGRPGEGRLRGFLETGVRGRGFFR